MCAFEGAFLSTFELDIQLSGRHRYQCARMRPLTTLYWTWIVPPQGGSRRHSLALCYFPLMERYSKYYLIAWHS